MEEVQRSVSETDYHSITIMKTTYIKFRTIKLTEANLIVSYMRKTMY